ncbi:uncharacterized protein LOC114717629 [Neltuma alba]|uniref:uncharacterized protein LOC114717629 n=1 Tax=Neltuma alba TaxID=207710 RepID=UPI0010A313B4|nr:uncharacterized protein LOC114717629 [Prosopis alba]
MISDHTTMTATTDHQWMMQLYQQSPDDDTYDHLLQEVSAMEGFISDANTVATTTSSSSPGPTSPKAINNGSRPIRRRSRASKRTPTTLLTANTTNFRALVQQFTGCPSSTAMSFEVYKGPITLNFQQGRRQVVHHHNNKSRTVKTVPPPAATAAPFGNTGFNNEGGRHVRQYHQQQQITVDQQQWRQQSGDDNLFDYNNTDLFSSLINNSSSKPSMEISDGMIVDHNYSLNDLTVNNNAFFSHSNDVIQNGNYIM